MKIPELIEKFNRKIEKFNSVLSPELSTAFAQSERGRPRGEPRRKPRASAFPARRVRGVRGREGAAPKEGIELLNFSIEFSDQFQKLHRNFSKLYRFSEILNEFKYFGACSLKLSGMKRAGNEK